MLMMSVTIYDHLLNEENTQRETNFRRTQGQMLIIKKKKFPRVQLRLMTLGITGPLPNVESEPNKERQKSRYIVCTYFLALVTYLKFSRTAYLILLNGQKSGRRQLKLNQPVFREIDSLTFYLEQASTPHTGPSMTNCNKLNLRMSEVSLSVCFLH